MMKIFTDEYFMKEALKEANKAFDAGEVPVGAIIVSGNNIIARAHNQTELLTDVTAHAEILAITGASNYLGSKYLADCTLYVTLEPCLMCAGALYWSQLGKLVFGAADIKRGYSKMGEKVLHPKTQIVRGILEYESADLLKRFFEAKRR
ncbi:MAG: nucleoside deaminase [Bacteroidota bacterium]